MSEASTPEAVPVPVPAWQRGLPWLTIGLAVAIALAAGLVRSLAVDVGDFGSVRSAYVSSEAQLLDRHGRLLHERRVDARSRRLQWVPLAEVSPALTAALVAVEDRRFWQHGGVDVRATAAAALATLRGRSRGASTLTMQLAGLLDASLRPTQRNRTTVQKLRQMATARAIEQRFSKSEILEAYLNLVSFRGELVGVRAASHALFDKSPHALDAAESWLLVALLRAPGVAAARVAETACALSSVQRARSRRAHGAGDDHFGRSNDDVNCPTLTNLAMTQLDRPRTPRTSIALAPHLAVQLLRGGGNVRTTLDADLQRAARDALAAQLLALRHAGVRDGAVLAVDNESGDVLAWVGSSGALSASPHVDFVRAPRQAGSTLKPFIYGLAFEQRAMTPESLLDDAPLDVVTVAGSYRPENYDQRFHGPVPARVALASSLNVPAVRVLERVGVDAAVVSMRALGIGSLRRADYYGPSLALGAADVSLHELVSAYRALARGGIAAPLRVRADAPSVPGVRVLGEGASFLVAEVLADRGNRSLTFGLESVLSTRFAAAVKTGTSKDMRDNWCFGFTRRYTVGVWVGNGSGEPMRGVSGDDGAAPVWLDVMSQLQAGVADVERVPPADVIRVGDAWLLRGTEASLVAAVTDARGSPATPGQQTHDAPDAVSFVASGAPVHDTPEAAPIAHKPQSLSTVDPVSPGAHAPQAHNTLDPVSPQARGPQVHNVMDARPARPSRIVSPAAGLVIAVDPDIPRAQQRVLIEVAPVASGLELALNARVLGSADQPHLWEPQRGSHELELRDAAGRVIDRARFVVR